MLQHCRLPSRPLFVRMVCCVPNPSFASPSFPPRAEHKELWLKTTVAMTGLLILPYTAFVLYKEATHEHHEHGPHYPHMRIRRKVRRALLVWVCNARARRAHLHRPPPRPRRSFGTSLTARSLTASASRTGAPHMRLAGLARSPLRTTE